MVEVDEKLLKLYLYMQQNTFSRDTVSDYLEISPRQLTRLLNKWSEEGFISFNSGVGRGNATTIEFLKNIEGEYINHLIREIESYDVQQLQSVMALNMTDKSKRILRLCVEEVLYSRRDYDTKHLNYVDYLYRIPNVIHPLEPLDVALLTVLTNVGDCLYTVRENELAKNLVVYDEWVGNDLVIHLHKDIHFSNGDLLFADDVVNALKSLVKARNSLPGLSDVIDIVVLDIFKFKIKLQRKTDLIKSILSQEFSAIYKNDGERILFTGPYYVDSIKPEILKLKINPYCTNKLPDITDIWLINDAEQYQEFVQSKALKVEHTKNSYSIDFLLFNPESKLTTDERLRLGRVVQDMEAPDVFVEELKLLGLKGSREKLNTTIEKLEQCVKSFEFIEISFDQYITSSLSDFNVDVVMMNEAVPVECKYFDLLMSGKFTEWMKSFKESQQLLYIYEHKSVDFWPYAERNYESFLIRNGLMVIIDYFGKKILKMDSFKDYEVNAYGIVRYDSIIAVEEVN
ncbi:ABC transporter substrate-binding protein [Macrococcus capreoli]|uniref:ABC transporter substrate-binding protein n=1 Tax=Macrococcus capreoli TaxID=2982690 RepID=UPI0021D5B3E4|nr:ABC transporter substrate-binding protein [Macrococcus sp. TMW 2.2395]MCU7557396.1 ABC transporter substrate-binding protein [Macrococcus sp. TMW 2.2395]